MSAIPPWITSNQHQWQSTSPILNTRAYLINPDSKFCGGYEIAGGQWYVYLSATSGMFPNHDVRLLTLFEALGTYPWDVSWTNEYYGMGQKYASKRS